MWLSGSMIFIALAEYIGHRFLMHRPVLDRIHLKKVFFNHAILHHKLNRTDLNLDLPVRTSLLWGLPFIVGAMLADRVGGLVLMAVVCSHAFLWTRLHRAIHDHETNWTQRLWLFESIKTHHLEHHRRPGKNFGAVFPLTDFVLRTKAGD